MAVKLFAKIIVIDNHDQILLVRKSKTAPRRAFDWEMPGGIVDEDEDPKFAAIRELEEEVGISVNDADYIFAGTAQDLKHTGFFFYTKVENSEPKLSYEHDMYKWVNLNDAIAIVSVESYKKALQYFQKQSSAKAIVSTKALVTFEGKTLALKRSSSDIGGGNWDLPGGRVESLEDLKDAIKRELKEETSLIVAKSEIDYAHTEVVDNEVRIRVGQTVTVKNDKVKLSDEHDEYRWLDSGIYDFMNHPKWPGWGEFVRKFS